MTEENKEKNNINEINQKIIEETRKIKIPYFTYEEEDPSQMNLKNKNKGKIPIYDLNEIFKINFSYNFDLLKGLLESLINNQKETQKELAKIKKEYDIKINELERNIIDMKITTSDPKYIQELQQEKEQLQIESEKIKNKVLKEKYLELERDKLSIENLEVKYIY